eukprot:6262819-Pyramimonas_sp.AAC.1
MAETELPERPMGEARAAETSLNNESDDQPTTHFSTTTPSTTTITPAWSARCKEDRGRVLSSAAR